MTFLDRVLDSPAKASKRVNQLRYLVTHLRDHAAFLKVLRAARRDGVVRPDILTGIKYLGIYLAASMTTEVRRSALAYHYAFLSRTAGRDGSARLWTEGAEIWAWHDAADGDEFSIRLEPATLSPMEGESQLCFIFGAKPLCTLTFSFIDGAIVGLPSEAVLFIGGIQGGANCRREIRIAARANGEIAPASMLLISARAIAEHLGVRYVVGISGEHHAAVPHAGDKITLGYDAMWLEAGALRTEGGFFVVVPGTEKPLAEVSRSHRARTRRKRELKLAVRQQIRTEIARLHGAAGYHSVACSHPHQEPEAAPPLQVTVEADQPA